MDARFSGGRRKFHNGDLGSDEVGKKKKSSSLEWDLNDWKWDGYNFVATPLNGAEKEWGNKQLAVVSGSNGSSSSSGSEETHGRGELEKRRKVIGGGDNNNNNNNSNNDNNNGLCGGDGPPLSLKLGGLSYSIAEEEDGNDGRSKLLGGNSSRLVCQVEGCRADLSSAKDYHRRHKVCEMHAKASWATVGGAKQRFCQQCSRFHLLEEFDEGKRSCRRRLAGHNRRRRKTHPDSSANGSALTDDNTSSYLLISLLKILTSLHSDKSEKSNNQDLISHLVKNIASLGGSSDSKNLPGTLQTSQGLHAAGTSVAAPSAAADALLSNGVVAKESSREPSVYRSLPVPVESLEMPARQNMKEVSPSGVVHAVPSQCSPTLKNLGDVSSAERGAVCSLQQMPPSKSAEVMLRVNDFDLNCTYNATEDCVGHEVPVSSNIGTALINCPSWMLRGSHQSSPPQTSGNSDSSSVHSLSNSSGEAKCRTDRIVFKLFGKVPNDFPIVLRTQILDWLSHSPTDMESYIRPGCIVLTIYLRVDDLLWEKLNHDICSSLNRLLHISGDDFWSTGWVYARLQNRMTFIYNGSIVLDVTPSLLENPKNCQVLSVTPIAVAASARVNFTVQGFNIAQPTAKLLCAFEGNYLATGSALPLIGSADSRRDCDIYEYVSFSCSLPNATGRGVIEVEDQGLSTGFFPFVVAEEDVCCEIRMLETSINVGTCDDIPHEKVDVTSARDQAIYFLNEMGWLLRRSHLKITSRQVNSHLDLFSLKRFRWLMAFTMDRGWCAVVKKLLDVLFLGIVDLCGRTPAEFLLSENLLHDAVRKNSKLMVKFLVTYKPNDETTRGCFLFRPDLRGPFDMTPLHVAASISGAEGVLDALINDPGQYGLKTWKSSRDRTGFTPEDYAIARGHESYIHLVQKKTNSKDQMTLDIPGGLSVHTEGYKSSKQAIFNVEKSRLTLRNKAPCKLCDRQQLACRTLVNRPLLYRPLMLSLVGIAAVCVCVGLLFKGPPEVVCVYPPFTWEHLQYGFM